MVTLVCFVAHSAGILRRMVLAPSERAHHRAVQRGKLLRWAFETLGASFIKAGQLISSRPDLFAPEVIAELRTLQDHVHTFAFRRARSLIERDLRAPVNELFTELDREPVAAGSIAQVHRGVLHDGREVAVKVLRPGVRARIRRDAAILLALARLAEWLSPRARAADVRGHTRAVVTGILAQTNLLHEAANYERFREQFADSEGLAFPSVHHELSTRDVLVMEFVRGASLDRAAPEHLPQVTRVMRSSFFAMCFEHGLVHADLHPGNVLVRPDGVLVMLDVGLVKHIAPHIVETLADFARCVVFGVASDLVKHLQRHHECSPSTNWTAVEADVTVFVAEIRGRSIAELETSVLVGHLFALARKHRIRPMAELSLVLLGMVTIEGIAKRLDPLANTLQEVAMFLRPSGARRRFARGSRQALPAPISDTRLTGNGLKQSMLVTCPESAHLEEIKYVDSPLGMLITACTRFSPARAVTCQRMCATRLDRKRCPSPNSVADEDSLDLARGLPHQGP
jgi:ubiquinone biosynthesis protein